MSPSMAAFEHGILRHPCERRAAICGRDRRDRTRAAPAGRRRCAALSIMRCRSPNASLRDAVVSGLSVAMTRRSIHATSSPSPKSCRPGLGKEVIGRCQQFAVQPGLPRQLNSAGEQTALRVARDGFLDRLADAIDDIRRRAALIHRHRQMDPAHEIDMKRRNRPRPGRPRPKPAMRLSGRFRGCGGPEDCRRTRHAAAHEERRPGAHARAPNSRSPC